MQLGYRMKKTMPFPLLRAGRTLKASIWHLLNSKATKSLPLADQFPWCSPNVWERIVNFYSSIPRPVVLEYGTGVASIWHVGNLLAQGGTYIGVEHKQDWYRKVLDEVISYGLHKGLNVKYTGKPLITSSNLYSTSYDAAFTLEGREFAGCTVKLKLRPPHERIQGTDGTLAEFREYVEALDETCDVIVVDGRARKACVNYVLDTNFLKPGGLLVLLEAGRGLEGWLGSPAFTGTSNYQPEVQRMLTLGGQVVNGSGLDRWPGLKRRRAPRSNAYTYPSEACFLVLPCSARGATL